jgi:pyruvate dehydrogenase E2 component (dihydrolipoamide acetyltransferase)
VPWLLDETRVAAGEAVTIPGLAGVFRVGEKYEPEALGLNDTELAAAVEKLNAPLVKVSGTGLASFPPAPDRAAARDRVTGDDVLSLPPDGDATRAAVERSDELEAEHASDVNATPAATELAAERNVDLATVEGSGSGGKVTKADVEEATG